MNETVKKMIINEISTFLTTVDSVKMSPEGFDSEVTMTVLRARIRFQRIVEQSVVVPSSADSVGNWRSDRVIPKEGISECIVLEITDVPFFF